MRELRDEFDVKTLINFNDRTAESEAKIAEDLCLNYLPLPDNPFFDAGDQQLHLAFMKAVRDAERNGEAPVYVHCRTGLDRAGLAVGVYRIVECNWTAEQALAELRRYQRPLYAMFFARYQDILHEVERTRDDWRSRLSETPAPTIRRPELAKEKLVVTEKP
jgi:protein-tyrosine phosphatase